MKSRSVIAAMLLLAFYRQAAEVLPGMRFLSIIDVGAQLGR